MTVQYPLEYLVRIKDKRLEEAERILKEKKEELEKELEKQKTLQQQRDETKHHKQDKLNQLRATLDEGTTSDKIEIMKNYIKTVDEELKQKERKVQEQIKKVQEAEKKVEEARIDFLKKQQDVEKLKTHRKEWEKEMKLLGEIEEAKETDELGSSIHSVRKHKSKGE